VQSAEYIRNEFPAEFLRRCVRDRYDDLAPRSEVYIDLPSGQQTSKYQVFLREIARGEYGYSIYEGDEFSRPVHRGRFSDVTEGSFMWIDASGADSLANLKLRKERFLQQMWT
jgi:hypothetical protein